MSVPLAENRMIYVVADFYAGCVPLLRCIGFCSDSVRMRCTCSWRTGFTDGFQAFRLRWKKFMLSVLVKCCSQPVPLSNSMWYVIYNNCIFKILNSLRLHSCFDGRFCNVTVQCDIAALKRSHLRHIVILWTAVVGYNTLWSWFNVFSLCIWKLH